MPSLLKIVRKYNVEPLLFFYMIGRNLYFPTPYTQLITDKVCLNSYHLNHSLCKHINDPEIKDSHNATLVFADTVNYVMYGQMILSIPSILAAIFLGPWLDMHSIAPKIVVLFTCFAALFESVTQMINVILFDAPAVMILISHILNGITGGNTLFMTSVFTIAMKETPLLERTFRFTIIEFAMLIPNPISNYISSMILPRTPFLIEEQTRNYMPIYMLVTILYFSCFVYSIFFLGEIKEIDRDADSSQSSIDDISRRASLRTSQQSINQNYSTMKDDPTLQITNGIINHTNANGKELKLNLDSKLEKELKAQQDVLNNFKNNMLNKSDKIREEDQITPDISSNQSLPGLLSKRRATAGEMLRSLFQLKNASAMFRSTIKKREMNAHILLWLTIIIYVPLLVFQEGVPLILLPFSSKMYGFSPSEFIRIDSIGHIAYNFAYIYLFCFHKVGVLDTKIIIIGLFSLLTVNFLIGSIMHPYALYASYLTGSAFLCAVVACRGFVSKIVPENEIGTVLGAMSVMYAISPVIASFVYTQIYRLSLNFYPGLAFLVGAAGTLLSIFCAIYLHIKYKKYLKLMANKKQLATG